MSEEVRILGERVTELENALKECRFYAAFYDYIAINEVIDEAVPRGEVIKQAGKVRRGEKETCSPKP